MQRADLTAIVERLPALRATAEGIESIRATADALPIDAFEEPVTFVLDERQDDGGQKKRLLAGVANDVRAWSRHMAYSVRVRLRSIESAVVRDISQGNLLPASILLRSHLESSALGVYCLDTVSNAARSGSTEELSEVMYKTLFGTAIAKHVARKEWVSELVSSAETNTIRICRAIDALDRYVYQENASGEIGVVYSVLCEFSHPNHRGVKAFKTSESTAGGWTIRYDLDEPFDPDLAIRLLNCLAVSMQAGYSASEMLRAWDFQDGPDGIQWIWPPRETVRSVWTTLIRRPA